MDPSHLYTGKARKYDRSRWDYSEQAIDTIFTQTGLDKTSAVADIGSGTGILGKCFIGRTRMVYLVEPNPDMRRTLHQKFNGLPACQVVDGRAEATSLVEQSINVITVGQAIHWFDPKPTRAEFRRIIKPEGYLAILRNQLANQKYNDALAELFHQIKQSIDLKINFPDKKPNSYYFKGGNFREFRFDFILSETRSQFIDSIASAADAPVESDPVYPEFERLADNVFEGFNRKGKLILNVYTELYLGKLG